MIDQRMTGLLGSHGFERTHASSDPQQQVWEREPRQRVVLTMMLGGHTEAEAFDAGEVVLFYSSQRLKAWLDERKAR